MKRLAKCEQISAVGATFLLVATSCTVDFRVSQTYPTFAEFQVTH